MLVAQAVRASEIFIDTEYAEGECERVYKRIVSDKENIVLIGMPGSGKSTVGKILAKALGRRLIDTDKVIVERAGKDIPTIFREDGEAKFREIEAEVIRDLASETGVIIATGGGAVLRGESVDALRENGRIYFIDRPLERLMPTENRPLASTREQIEKRYRERYRIYKAAADVRVFANCFPKAVAEKIIKDFTK
jgi:shikimate dehydrogenase